MPGMTVSWVGPWGQAGMSCCAGEGWVPALSDWSQRVPAKGRVATVARSRGPSALGPRVAGRGGKAAAGGAAFARRASSAILLFFPPHFPHLAKPRELWGPPAAGQGSIVRPVVCLVGGGAAATVRVREPGQPASTTMPSARPRRLDKRQPTVSTAMPSARPSGASEVRRRLRPRRRPWPPSVRRSAPLPPAPGAPSPGPRSPLVAGAGCPAAAATVIDTGYWRVRMVGGEGRMRAGMDSTISRMAARRMLAGSRVRAVTRKVARSARERVLGWSRSTQQLPPRRCSAVDRCQACAGMPRSSNCTECSRNQHRRERACSRGAARGRTRVR